jgi:hypothetical protein
MEILEGRVKLRDGFALSAGQDDREDRLQDEEEDAVKDTGEDPEENAPDEADLERLHVAEETPEDGAAVFGEVVGRGAGDV